MEVWPCLQAAVHVEGWTERPNNNKTVQKAVSSPNPGVVRKVTSQKQHLINVNFYLTTCCSLKSL